MFDIESQLFLTHGQECGLDSNDGGSLESGPGSANQEEELQDHGDSIQLHQVYERERQVACGNPAGYYDGFRGHVIEVRRHLRTKAQEEIRKGRCAHFACAISTKKKRKAFCEQLLPRLKLGKARVLAKCRPGIDVRSIVFTDEKFFRSSSRMTGCNGCDWTGIVEQIVDIPLPQFMEVMVEVVQIFPHGGTDRRRLHSPGQGENCIEIVFVSSDREW